MQLGYTKSSVDIRNDEPIVLELSPGIYTPFHMYLSNPLILARITQYTLTNHTTILYSFLTFSTVVPSHTLSQRKIACIKQHDIFIIQHYSHHHNRTDQRSESWNRLSPTVHVYSFSESSFLHISSRRTPTFGKEAQQHAY